MLVAISSEGKDIDSTISDKAGRAPYYIIAENEKVVEVWKNPFAVGGGGAGWSVAKALADKGVKKVIVGKAGPNFLSALKERDIEVVEHKGLVRDFV